MWGNMLFDSVFKTILDTHQFSKTNIKIEYNKNRSSARQYLGGAGLRFRFKTINFIAKLVAPNRPFTTMQLSVQFFRIGSPT